MLPRVNYLPMVAIWQCGGWQLNLQPVDCKSNTITEPHSVKSLKSKPPTLATDTTLSVQMQNTMARESTYIDCTAEDSTRED